MDVAKKFASFHLKSVNINILPEVYTFIEVYSALERKYESHKRKCNLCVVCIFNKANPRPSFPSGIFVLSSWK